MRDNSTGFNNLKGQIRDRITQDVLPKTGEALEWALMDVLTDKHYWPYFAGKVTVRENPNASQPIAYGANRDSRDTDRLINSVDSDVNPSAMELDLHVEVDDPDTFYEQRPIFDVLLSEVNIKQIFEESWNEIK